VVRAPITTDQIAARADVLTTIESRWRAEGVQLVKFPRPGFHAYNDCPDEWHPNGRSYIVIDRSA
jgi:hypothetical protein